MGIKHVKTKPLEEARYFKYGIESLQGKLVDIILLPRHSGVANKQLTSMGYYFGGRGKKCEFHPIMRHIRSLFPIWEAFSGNYGLSCPIVFEVSYAK